MCVCVCLCVFCVWIVVLGGGLERATGDDSKKSKVGGRRSQFLAGVSRTCDRPCVFAQLFGVSPCLRWHQYAVDDAPRKWPPNSATFAGAASSPTRQRSDDVTAVSRALISLTVLMTSFLFNENSDSGSRLSTETVCSRSSYSFLELMAKRKILLIGFHWPSRAIKKMKFANKYGTIVKTIVRLFIGSKHANDVIVIQ